MKGTFNAHDALEDCKALKAVLNYYGQPLMKQSRVQATSISFLIEKKMCEVKISANKRSYDGKLSSKAAVQKLSKLGISSGLLKEINEKFQFLLEFLENLRRWKESTDNRPGNFSQNVRSRMFISWQTQEGYKITVHSAIEATKFLLHEGTEFVLTERFRQDPLEEYFGNQRKLGRRSDNPDIRSFGYNANTIRIQRTVSCQSGNTIGRKDKRRSWEQITDSKLPCRKKRKLN
ncbi:hypothetical protein ACROYT_G014926 [Oculina patagonica]